MAIKKKKFFEVEIPLIRSKQELLAYSIEDLKDKTIKLDLTRELRGKSIEIIFKIKLEKDKLIASPTKLTLLPFFIRRMLRKSISYVEDSFSTECEDAVRKALRDEAKNWLQDYLKNKSNEAIFSEAISNKLQKSLSLHLKKIYPLALCEIRILNIEKLKEQEKLKVKVEKITKQEEKEEEKPEED